MFKFAIQVFFLSFFSFLQAQQGQSIEQKSHALEIEGWHHFFDRNKENAWEKFQQALEVNEHNVLAKIGLFNSIPVNELTEEDLQLIDDLPEDDNQDYSYRSLSLGLMMKSQIEKEMPDSLLAAVDTYDERYIKLRAALTDSKFQIRSEDGSVRRDGQFFNRRPIGEWKFYDYEDRVMFSHTYPKKGDTVITTYYKPDGEVARKRWVKGNPLQGSSTSIKEVVYWQEDKGRSPKYLFVSKEGYYLYDKTKEGEEQLPVPDNIIGQSWNAEKKQLEGFIWKNGKKEPYELCEEDGVVTSQTAGNERKTYRWENCKKLLIKTEKLD
ncbi:MAG: hypothetical protein AB3N14_02510 [Flavobacteriaceae bacterium]